MHDKIPKEMYIVAELKTHLKIKIFERLSPLKLKITYPEAHYKPDVLKSLTFYVSQTVKEPNEIQNDARFIYPKLVVIQGEQDPKTGKSKFISNHWLYITINAEVSCHVVIQSSFRVEYKKEKKNNNKSMSLTKR